MSHVRIKVARKFVPHLMLLAAAERALDAGRNKETGYWWDWLAAALYCALSVEAIGNTYGETLIARWQDFESASPIAKIRLVAEHCGVRPDFSGRPWSILPEMIRFRNRIAHARPERISVDKVFPKDEYEKHLYAKPESKLEQMVTQRFAEECYESIHEILRAFAPGLPRDMLIEVESDHWHGGAEPAGAS